MTAPSPRVYSHFAKQSSDSNSFPIHNSRREDPRRDYINYPNGRGFSCGRNGVALLASTNSSFISSTQPHQDSSPLLSSQRMGDLLPMVKKCLDDLIQPFYCAIVERLSHLSVDSDSIYGFSGSSNQLSSASPAVLVDPLGYPPLPSQP